MRPFVEECRREWNRLGVPEVIANEMAADLDIDLAEAEADGVSPEEVLGNGYFDARAFAAEWAGGRGVVGLTVGTRRPVAHLRVRPLILVLSGVACLFLVALGLLMVVGGHGSSMSVAVVAFRHAFARPVPGIFVRAARFGPAGPGGPIAALGLLLLVFGLVGGGVTLWFWRRRSTHPNQPELERSIGMPTYL